MSSKSGVAPYFALQPNRFYVTVDQYAPNQFDGWVNGRATATKVEASWDSALPHLFIGSSGTSFNENWSGDLAEIIVYARTLTDAERATVVAYLTHKYALNLAQ